MFGDGLYIRPELKIDPKLGGKLQRFLAANIETSTGG
jgi:hypothetical protein